MPTGKKVNGTCRPDSGMNTRDIARDNWEMHRWATLLSTGYYLSLPHRLRLFPPTYANNRYQDNSHGLYRLAYRNADYTLLDRRSEDGPSLEFFLYVLRHSDSTIYELYNKRQINKVLRIPKSEQSSARKSLKNRRDWKGVVKLIQQYSRRNRTVHPNNTTHDSQNH